MSTLNLDSSVVIYDDGTPTNNPYLRIPDWTKHLQLDVSNPQAGEYTLAPGATLSIFDGSSNTSIDNTTQFNLTLNPLSPSIYRFTWNNAGTNPAFRIDRGLAFATNSVTVSVNNNATARFTSGGAATFTGMQVGDTLFIPGVTTGDNIGPFNILNEGYWQVLSVTATSITVCRPSGQAFSGMAETVTVASNDQMIAFSANGVLINDKVEISAGFSAVTWGTYTVTSVTPTWFEIKSTASLPLEDSIAPSTAGMTFYNKTKRFVRIETDQDAAVRLNGDSGNLVRISPILPGDSDGMSLFEKIGPTWSLTLVNRSPVYTLNAVVITAE